MIVFNLDFIKKHIFIKLSLPAAHYMKSHFDIVGLSRQTAAMLSWHTESLLE